MYRITASTFLDEDNDSTRRFLAAALAPTTNTFAGTSTERLQNEVVLVREKQRSPTVFQRYAQQNLLSVQAVRPTAKGSEEAELGRQEALLLSKTNQDLFFFYVRRKLLIRFAHITKIKEHSSSCFFLHSLENRETTAKLLRRPKKFSDP